MLRQRLIAILILASVISSAPACAGSDETWFVVKQGRCIAAESPDKKPRTERDEDVAKIVTVDAEGRPTETVHIRGLVRCEDLVKDVQRSLLRAADSSSLMGR